jgi:hypothetical protein
VRLGFRVAVRVGAETEAASDEVLAAARLIPRRSMAMSIKDVLFIRIDFFLSKIDAIECWFYPD